ncbi:MAG: hypothetical protein ACM3PZ_00185 [Bacillota bacterium]
MQNLLTWRFWFNLRPEPLLPLFNYLFLGLIGALIIATIATGFLQRRKSLYKGVWRRAYVFSFSNSVVGVALFFFNYERAAFLSGRFWILFWGITMIAWLAYILKGIKRPANKEQLEKEREFKKYLP